MDTFNVMLFKLLQNQNNTLQRTINNTNNFINNYLLKKKNLKKELQEWNKQIINNFKIKYPEYDYVNIINFETPLNIETSLNIEKEEYFCSRDFEVFGLQWTLYFYPKGDGKSKEGKCAIFFSLSSLQYKKENEEEISSIKIKYFIDSINLNDSKNDEYFFTCINEGCGNRTFKQSNFIPKVKNDKQIFSIVIGMKKIEIEFK